MYPDHVPRTGSSDHRRHQLLRAILGGATDIKVVSHQEQEALAADELPATRHRVSIAQRSGLRNEADAFKVWPGSDSVGVFVPRSDDHTDLLHASLKGLFNNDRQRGLGRTIAIHKGLQGQGALAFAGGRDESFADFHAFQLSRIVPIKPTRRKHALR